MTSEVRECSVARTLELVGAKWTLLAVRELLLGSHRFEEIVRYTGAPRDILTDRLRRLEAEGLVVRSQYQERPPRFEYHLSDLGRSLIPIIATMREFGDRHLAGADGPPLRLEHSCGEEYHPVLACKACGEVVGRGEVGVVGFPAAAN
ncbi:helix-turn-helix transcriptional regulator [Nocardioides carbamazepini]|jgi:DNA-binding HxlR family transcriptional regulator|uniref:winged helix-turn-helix transcriptional regulator n=1 Tax=Nocardioides carbamazepini TaxID=2854259 RepID=UPI00214A50B2|nr:helix-turn-helix domain-containing protein [Nocardioides carbamazepini]MCR1785671.1 helix-turn-helix transcriptional regulator [Nocardioides carbamazepini]